MPSVTSSCGVSLSVLYLILAAENLDWRMRFIYTEVNQEFKALMSSLEDFIFLTEMLFRWNAQHKISTDIVTYCQNYVN